MSESTNRSWIVGAAIFFSVGVVIFLIGAVLGYCRGVFRDGGTVDQGFDWALKTGFLLVAILAFVGAFGILVTSKLKLPPYIGSAIGTGLTFALMNGGDVLLGMSDKDFWHETITGGILGAFCGATSWSIIRRKQKRRIQDDQFGGEASTDQ